VEIVGRGGWSGEDGGRWNYRDKEEGLPGWGRGCEWRGWGRATLSGEVLLLFFIGREFRRAFQDSTLQQSILTLKAPKPQYYLTIHVVHQTSNGRNFFN
jgi:hypothetical protein